MKTTTYADALNNVKRGTALGYPATLHWGLLKATKGPRSALNSATVAVNDTVCLIPTGGSRMQLYKVTSITTGILAASQGALYPGVANEAIVDGGATLTEQTSALQAGTAQVEPAGNAYARAAMVGNTTNWAASSGRTIANAGTAWTWPQATPAGWTTGLEAIWGVGAYDAASAGSCWEVLGLTAAIQVSALATPSIAAGSLTDQEI